MKNNKKKEKESQSEKLINDLLKEGIPLLQRYGVIITTSLKCRMKSIPSYVPSNAKQS